MHVISRKKLKEFWEINKGSERVLDDWYRIAKQATWQNLAEIHQTFPAADAVGDCIVFDVGKNKYRVITKAHFREKTLLVREVLTHKEYDKNNWKLDCGFKKKTSQKKDR